MRDHPRVCGEQAILLELWRSLLGSSPRMRGTVTVSSFPSAWARIIPAYAGNRLLAACCYSLRWDHPRVCGEQLALDTRMISIEGSSPRMRGTVTDTVRNALNDGIIPAYAGNSIPVRRRVQPRRDHPRVCGEQLDRYQRKMQKAGSSPRMRGTAYPLGCVKANIGIIPAYAGNSYLRNEWI